MDSSETHYVTYDPDVVWDEMHRTYIQSGGDILYPGDEKEILLRAVLAIAVSIMAKVDSALRMDTLTYATGDYLKLYGEKRNCIYKDAVAAEAPITITFQATGISQTVEAGTELTADGTILWELTEDIAQTGTAQTVSTTIRCKTPGTAGNGLYSGAEMQFIQPVDGAVSAIVSADASGGVDAEDEEAYRERIRQYGLATVTTGPAQMYESLALKASTDIVDAKAINDGDGEVGIYLILASGASQTAVFNSVEQALSDITSRPLTDHVVVHEATAVSYTLNVKVWYSSYAGIGDDVVQAKNDYQAWQDNKIGRAFNPDKLVAMLYQAGCDRVQFLPGSGMGTEPESAEYTEIDPDEHCSGTITLTVVNS